MRVPAWTSVLCGWLVGLGLLVQVPARSPGPLPGCGLDTTLIAPISPRRWRAVPGIGRRRSLQLARALWEAGASDPAGFDLAGFDVAGLRGFGPATAARVREFMASRGDDSRDPIRCVE